MKKSLLIIAAIISISCRPNDNSDECQEPVTSCNNCFIIYDDKGNFVNQMDVRSYENVYWDGKDCKGRAVPCGQYTVISNFYGRTNTEKMMVMDENATSAQGRKACDSLKQNCNGTYYEGYSSSIDGSSILGCMCCQ